MDRFPHFLRLALVMSIWCAREVHGQAPYTPFEFQFGIQIPTEPLYRDQFTNVRRSPGVSTGLLLYSYLENPVGFRVRGDLTLTSVESTEARFAHSELIKEFAIGVDAAPRFIRVSVRDVEARFYAGFALRAMFDSGDDVTVLQGGPAGFNPDNVWRYTGAGVGVIGRAGWFVRRASKASLLRLDAGYQIGEVNGVLQHEILLRVGVGSN